MLLQSVRPPGVGMSGDSVDGNIVLRHSGVAFVTVSANGEAPWIDVSRRGMPARAILRPVTGMPGRRRAGHPKADHRKRAMKAVAVFPGSQEVKVVEQEFPRLAQPDQVTLRMLDIGICGTDKEICSFEYGTPPPGDDHLVIGHESVAEIVDVGAAVERLAPGDLVVPSVRRPCPHPGCLACRSGHQDYCYTGDFSERGIKEAHGYMAEYVVDHEQYMNVVPPDLREIAVLAEPLTIAEKALAQIFWMMQQRPPWIDPETPSEERGQGLSALVLGIGPVGLLGAMVLVSAGFTTYVYSRELPPSPRIDLVAAIGATYVSSQTATFGQLAEQIGNIDLIYEAVGHSHFALAGAARSWAPTASSC